MARHADFWNGTPIEVQVDEQSDGITQNYEALYRSYMALVRDVDHLAILREISLAVNATLELNEVLPIIAAVVQGALEVKRLTVFEIDPEHGIARPVVAKYGSDLIRRSRLEEEAEHLDGSELGLAAQALRVRIANTPYGSTAHVPLVAKNALVGVMRLEDPIDGESFSDDDSQLFQEVGQQIALAIHNAQLYALAVTDGLTDLYVRRYFDIRLREEFSLARRYGRRFSLLLFDIDHFKQFNDTHGHQTGDLVLQQFARLLRNNTRQADICCRYGGEEMAVILPETRIAEAAMLAQKLCERVRRLVFTGTGDKQLHVTTSVGVAQFDETLREPADMVAAADEALYRAKAQGRDRVELANT